MVSIFLHWLASEGCRSNSSVLLRACSKCQLISSESLGFENKRFKRAITGRYHMIMAGIFSSFLHWKKRLLPQRNHLRLHGHHCACIGSSCTPGIYHSVRIPFGIGCSGSNTRVFFAHPRLMEL